MIKFIAIIQPNGLPAFIRADSVVSISVTEYPPSTIADTIGGHSFRQQYSTIEDAQRAADEILSELRWED